MMFQLGHYAGYVWGGIMPVVLGGTGTLVSHRTTTDLASSYHRISNSNVLWGPASLTAELLPAFRDKAIATDEVVGLSSVSAQGLRREVSNFATVVRTYAMTELGVVTLSDPALEGPNPETDGTPIEGVNLQLRDADQNSQGIGRLYVASPYSFMGYAGTKGLTAKWFDTHDLGCLKKGFFSWQGRVGDVIRRGGENVPVPYIEAILREHPDVADCVLVPVPDVRLGSKACAAVIRVPNSAIDPGGLISYLKEEGVTVHYLPEYFEFFDEFPRSILGKPRRPEIADLVMRRMVSRADNADCA
jgi:acyl-CoA synthetase (AMP-forming)/AMP-acid ligase II